MVAKKLSVPTGSGFVDRLLNTSGKILLFQLNTKANMEATMIPGRDNGITTLRIAPILLAPSTMAASSRATGISSKKLLITNMENGMVNVW